MKMLKDHTLIYDSECPMCAGYTKLFTKKGLLDEKGRLAYSEMHEGYKFIIDTNRAKNEIALVNHQTGKITYGIESLVKILSHNWPIINRIYQIKWVQLLLTKLYFFISYNRKIIVPVRITENSCTPDVRYKYRWAYITLCWLITAITLFEYSELLQPLIPGSNISREFYIAGGQIVFQFFTLKFLKQDRKLDYIGNMMTVSLVGSLLLLPALIVGQFINAPYIFTIYFMGVVGFMIIEHMRRVKLLELNFLLTPTWILYRILILGIILFL